MTTYLLFHNYENGTREFGYYFDEEEAREAMQEAEQHYRRLGTAVEVGIAEIVETVKMNWVD